MRAHGRARIGIRKSARNSTVATTTRNATRKVRSSHSETPFDQLEIFHRFIWRICMPIDPITIPPGGGDGTFPDTALGAIIWPKALGRPNKPHLADGFSILMHGTDVQATGQGG